MAEKIAITVDPDLLVRVESLRRRTKESRSAVFNRAARLLLGAEEHRRRIERYLEAYRERPESESDLALAEDLARSSLERVGWDE
jgi:metal-responsive CopG/Arc/MetJ family transcriptional regulator